MKYLILFIVFSLSSYANVIDYSAKVGQQISAAELHESLQTLKTLIENNYKTTCHSDYYTISDGHLCMSKTMESAKNMFEAIETCFNKTPSSRVCTHNDFQQACGELTPKNINPYSNISAGWYGDHNYKAGGNTDDEYLTWNNPSCADNNDGNAKAATEINLNFRCCY